MNPSLATIALGANIRSTIGAPAVTLAAALDALRPLGELSAVSSLWLTPPVGFADQPWFHNAVAQLRTPLDPASLLTELLRIEMSFGRNRAIAPANGPRTLDLDLLLYDDRLLSTKELTLPHPRLTDRAFVLLPLAEIAPTLVHPLTRLTIADHLALLPAEHRAACTQLNSRPQFPPETQPPSRS